MNSPNRKKNIKGGDPFDASGGFQHENHARPISRRDFVAQGLISAASYLLIPSVVSLTMRSSYAAAMKCASANPGVPCLIFDAAGGIAIAQETATWGKGGVGDFLAGSAYTRLGFPDGNMPSGMTVDPAGVGGIAWHKDSKINAGLKSTTSLAVRNKVSGSIFASVLGDDTRNNEINPAHLIAKVSSGGLLQVAGNIPNPSGGFSRSTENIPDYFSYQVSGPDSLLRMKSLGALKSAASSNPARISSIMDRMKALASLQLGTYSEKELPPSLRSQVDCRYEQASTLGKSEEDAAGLDYRIDPKASAIFNSANAEENELAAIVYLLLSGGAGVGVFTKGGGDYHIGNRTTGDAYNLRMGELLGKCLSLASAMGKKFMIIVITDGSVGAGKDRDPSSGYAVWTSDGGEYGASMILAHDPAGAPEMRTHQLGWFDRDAGGVDRGSSVFANSPSALGYSMYANYLAFSGRLGEFESLVKADHALKGVSLSSVVSFKV